MGLDVVELSRLQFALTVMFHYLFPPLSIGLGLILVCLEGSYLATRQREYESLARFFTGIFAVNFAMGVASGIVMEFQFGTNWATYSRFVGDVFGSALAAEGIFAFFLESGFLAVLVFGWDRVGPRMHFFSTCMVCLGAIFSSIWIVVANSWQQTPAGYEIREYEGGLRAEITDFWAVVFNPSSMHRLGHVLLGAFILGAFVVMSIMAFYILRNRHRLMAEKAFTTALIVGTVSSVLMVVSGHFQAETVAETQPTKLAAFEGVFETNEGGTGMYLFGWPSEETEKVHFGVEIPNALSILVHKDPNEPVTGLDQFPPEDRPPVWVPFQTYHLMVALGCFFVAVTLYASFLRWRGKLFETRWLMWVFVWSVFLPYIANQAGWVAAEVGRQPWVVWGELRTSDAISSETAVPAWQVASSLVLFCLIYLMLLAIYVYVLNGKIQKGPHEPVEHEPSHPEEGFFKVAADRADPSGKSMSEARESDDDDFAKPSH